MGCKCVNGETNEQDKELTHNPSEINDRKTVDSQTNYPNTHDSMGMDSININCDSNIQSVKNANKDTHKLRGGRAPLPFDDDDEEEENEKELVKPEFNQDLNKKNDFESDFFIWEEPKDAFSLYLFNQINKVRRDPTSIIPLLKDGKERISMETIVRNGIEEKRYIYKGIVKVALVEGESAFEDAINDLKYNIKPMAPLKFSKEITVMAPKTEEEINDKDYIKNYVNDLTKNGLVVNSYWRDIVKDADTAFLLMIVDDTGKKAGIKRRDIFNKNFKYVGISSNKIKKAFATYFTFSQ